MKTVKVPGKNKKHQVSLYTLSTCGWCKQLKTFLKDKDIEYEYTDIDLSDEEDRFKIRRDIQERGGSLNYPTIIIDDKILIEGFVKDKLMVALEI
ncbi:MAG: glutaredoxin family protein [Candidatus Bathyarchaeota archaeon]